MVVMKHWSWCRKVLPGLLAACMSAVVPAAEARPDAGPADWQRAEAQTEEALGPKIREAYIFPDWIRGGRALTFYRDGRQWVVDARNGRVEPLIADEEDFRGQYLRLTGDSLDGDFRLYGLETDGGDDDRIVWERRGRRLVFVRSKNRLELAAEPQKEEPRKRPGWHTADSAFSMLGCGHDLYVRTNATGRVKRLTFDGREDASFTFRAEPDTAGSRATGFWLGHYYVCVVQDKSRIREMGIVHALGPDRPRLETFRMPMPGDEGVRQTRIWWYDADRDEGRYLDIAKYPDQEVELNYFRSDSVLFFTRCSRKGDWVDLCRIRVREGRVEELISEHCPPHVNRTLFTYRLIGGGRQILWWSERTGRGNYYLYDASGRLLNRVTRGERLVAAEVVRIDERRREMIFKGYGQEGANPYYACYYRVGLNGRGQRLLTPGEGMHALTLSDDGRWAFDQMSRLDLPPVYRVLSVDRPQKSHTFAAVGDSALRAAGWRPPLLVRVKAADGLTDLYGVVYLPLDIPREALSDTSWMARIGKYPVITNVYPGPQDDQVPRAFAIDDNGNQSLAALGFVVVNIGGRGSSPLRGREFYNFGYGNLRDYPLADCRHVLEELAARYPFMDLSRVGIYGHSGGAFQTVAAMLTEPDFYKVGVAASGNHDNNIYIQWWGETFHGVEERRDSLTGRTVFECRIPTNMELAGNLKGRLLLITGDVDKNVPPANTFRMADALIRKNKRFDMFVLPGKDHGVMCPYYLNLIRYYFIEHLVSPERVDMDLIRHE